MARARQKFRSDSGTDQLGQFELGYALEYVQPASTQVVAVGMRYHDKGFDGVDVLCFHVHDGRVGGEESKSGINSHKKLLVY